MGNVINGAYSICVQDPPPEEAEMKRSRTTSADEDQDLEQGESSAEPTGPMERLIAAASAGLESIEMPEAGQSNVADLMCSHCHSMLFRVRLENKILIYMLPTLPYLQPAFNPGGREDCVPAMRAQGEGDACPRLVIRQQGQHCPRRRRQRYEKKLQSCVWK